MKYVLVNKTKRVWRIDSQPLTQPEKGQAHVLFYTYPEEDNTLVQVGDFCTVSSPTSRIYSDNAPTIPDPEPELPGEQSSPGWADLQLVSSEDGFVDDLTCIGPSCKILTADVVIRGIAPGRPGQRVTFASDSGLRIAHESSDVIAANRIKTVLEADLILVGRCAFEIMYDAHSQRWIVLWYNA